MNSPFLGNERTSGRLHNLRYILESELGVEREKIEESGIINAKDSGKPIPSHLAKVTELLYDTKRGIYLTKIK